MGPLPLWIIKSQSSNHLCWGVATPQVRLGALLNFRSTECTLSLQLPGLRPTPPSPPSDAASNWDFMPDDHSAHCYYKFSFSVCKLLAYWETLLTKKNKLDIVRKDRNVCE